MPNVMELDLDLLDFLKPEKRLTVNEWADEHRILSQKSSAEPGKYRTSRTPYLKQMMADLSACSPREEIIVMKGAQVGFSEIGNNWVGYIIDHAPAPCMVVLPNIDMAKRNSKTRIEPLIEESPRLRSKVKEKKSRDSSNTILSKDFPGGVLILAGANSAAGLRSAPIRYLFLDEVDGYKQDLDGEGSPIKLARARTRTFSKRKILQGSTPTIKGQSAIESAFEDTDQNYYQVACIACGFYQKIVWEQIKWTDNDPQTAHFECVDCKHKMYNYEKSKLFETAKWVPDFPERSTRTKIGYHINSLYSPHGWYSWAEAVNEFIEAKKSPELLKTWLNTVLGLTWAEKGEAPEWRRLYERRESYKTGIIPDGVCFLTAGVDVQADRIELEIVGWCPDKISYSIDYRVLTGDTSGTEVWQKLADVALETYPLQLTPNLRMGLKMMAVDSGYRTQTVYDWVRKMQSSRIIAIKGMDNLNLIHGLPKASDITIAGKTKRRGLKVWPVGSSQCKTELYGWLRQPKAIEPDAPPYGYCFFPEYDPEFFKMLTAEKLVTRTVKGYTKREWIKERERNESLDCRCYARAAASIIGMDRFKPEHWEKMKLNLTGIKNREETHD